MSVEIYETATTRYMARLERELEEERRGVGQLRARVEELERWLRDGCPAHGYHPHNGATCLDCPICRPLASKVPA